MNHKTIAAVITIITIILYGLFMVGIGQRLQLDKMQQVRTVCLTGDNQACSKAMTATSTEFICNASNCWTEVK